MLSISTREDLERLIKDEVKESLTLDYKRSDALAKEDRKRDELCKDVTAFANSAGGQLVFGIEEDKHVPLRIDNGATSDITKEWIEQVSIARPAPHRGPGHSPDQACERLRICNRYPAGIIARATSGAR
jgi:predicted HTH transcriptional regulator